MRNLLYVFYGKLLLCGLFFLSSEKQMFSSGHSSRSLFYSVVSWFLPGESEHSCTKKKKQTNKQQQSYIAKLVMFFVVKFNN